MSLSVSAWPERGGEAVPGLWGTLQEPQVSSSSSDSSVTRRVPEFCESVICLV